MRIVKFKIQGSSLVISGQTIRQHDLDNNPSLYDYLLEVSADHAKLFDVTEESAPVKNTKQLADAK